MAGSSGMTIRHCQAEDEHPLLERGQACRMCRLFEESALKFLSQDCVTTAVGGLGARSGANVG